MCSPALPADPLAAIAQAQAQLTELEATAKGLIDELVASGAQATPRLRELLASGERLVAAVQLATGKLGGVLPMAGGVLPTGPDRATVEAMWAQQQVVQQGPPLLPTPAGQPAASLAELAASLSCLPDVRLQLLEGQQPTAVPAQATAAVLHCSRAFAAVVHLQPPGSLVPLRVGVLSAAEAAAALDGSARGSLWAPSQHALHLQLAAQATEALRHFRAAAAQQEGAAGASALELLLLWLATCGDIFSRRATASGSLLLADPAAAGEGLLPPLRRPWQLGWQALWQAALNPQLRQAEHLLG